MAKKLKPDITSKREKFRLFGELPELSGPIIRVCSNREVSVDGCQGVTEYYDNRIKLKIPGGWVVLSGSGLAITSFSDTAALINGRLENIEFNIR